MSNKIETLLYVPKTVIIRNIIRGSFVSIHGFELDWIELPIHELPKHLSDSSLMDISKMVFVKEGITNQAMKLMKHTDAIEICRTI
jgi:hypothetical protein